MPGSVGRESYLPPRDFGEYVVCKRRKLAEQQQDELAALTKGVATQCLSSIFRGVAIYATGYIEPSAVKLRELVCLHGGRYEQYYNRSRVTHIVATTLTSAKFRQWRHAKIVRPAWIVDSVRKGRLLAWSHYCLYNAREYTDERAFWQKSRSPPQERARTIAKDAAEEACRPTSMRSLPTSATDENFVANYYASSRLHHLSSWKAELRDICAKLELSHAANVDTRRRVVMHIDMDCFFTSVAVRDRPELAGCPVGISHSTVTGSSSDLASCNYEARAYGLKNGMRVGEALKKCPHLVLLPYEFAQYKAIFAEYAAQIQAVSCDEALLGFPLDRFLPGDIAENAQRMAREIRDKIHAATRCTASQAKPNGQHFLNPAEAQPVLDRLPVKRLPGVGWSLDKRLKDKHIETGGDLRKIALNTLQCWFGTSTGQMLYSFARGIDERPLQTTSNRQSISTNVSWGVRFVHTHQVEKFIGELAEEVARRTVKEGVVGRMIVYKRKPDAVDHAYKVFGHGDCDILQQGHMLSTATQEAGVIKETSWRLFGQMNLLVADVRGIGIQLLKLASINKDSG
ncbi:hypothetical protein SYNPS1DRAFT_21082 [Syncephalis pseudoplumigaleata]|uniref:DNA repair protein REV1 n=1 Tax=Syncephalis pseudoplumigaleata TaxID=1712513 RepID=A0A4P9Z489_9FUNG|nr:hypothetical protein SYNPS1DRAFT_21082 [Syncephalis pseudoplumigaleata]|eukprot:RKP27377.1 hypothetical protein SYNPS1DRAFT_21082 [Syncephalis pseudoplumigaleata]